MSETIPREKIESGDKVLLKWSPYEWALKRFDVSATMAVEVTDTYVGGDIRVETSDGMGLTVNTNRYVTSGEGGSPFDKGRFRRFEKVQNDV